MNDLSLLSNITDDRRQAIFRAVIEAQDDGMSVQKSRSNAAGQFEVTVEQVKAIERLGIEQQWPPLSD